MNNEEQFKNSVKDLLDERQFAYDASNWEEAKRVLDEKAKRRRGFFFLFSGLGLGLMFLGYFLFLPALKETAVTSAQLSVSSVDTIVKSLAAYLWPGLKLE